MLPTSIATFEKTTAHEALRLALHQGNGLQKIRVDISGIGFSGHRRSSFPPGASALCRLGPCGGDWIQDELNIVTIKCPVAGDRLSRSQDPQSPSGGEPRMGGPFIASYILWIFIPNRNMLRLITECTDAVPPRGP